MPPSAKCLFEAVDVVHIWLKSKPGRLTFLETGSIIFEGPNKRVHIPIKTIRFAFNRYQLHPKTTHQIEDKATEIFTTSNKSFVFIFVTTQIRTDFYRAITRVWEMPLFSTQKIQLFFFLPNSRKFVNPVVKIMILLWLAEKLKLTEHWNNYELTTFTYLYCINRLGDRSYRRTAHYPFYPLADQNRQERLKSTWSPISIVIFLNLHCRYPLTLIETVWRHMKAHMAIPCSRKIAVWRPSSPPQKVAYQRCLFVLSHSPQLT